MADRGPYRRGYRPAWSVAALVAAGVEFIDQMDSSGDPERRQTHMANGRDRQPYIFLMKNGDVAEVIRGWFNTGGTRWIVMWITSPNGLERSEQWLPSMFLSLIDKDITPDLD
jgi:hypothetical protein